MSEIEIVTFHCGDTLALRHRIKADAWQFALKHGSIDELDKSVVEILKIHDGESEVTATFNNVVMVGSVCWMTQLLMPEKIVAVCNKCKSRSIQ